jgi:hypothetical protein
MLCRCILQANLIGSGRRLTSTVNSCGICGSELNDFSHVGEQVGLKCLVNACVQHVAEQHHKYGM